MKSLERLKLVVVLILTIVKLLGTVSAANAGANNPFIGKWEGVDSWDNSYIRVTISEPSPGVFRLIWQEDYWTICDGDPGFGRGTGTIDGDNPYLMHASIDLYCGSTYFGALVLDFEYDPGTDTINGWNRVGRFKNPFIGRWPVFDSIDNINMLWTISEPSPGVFRVIWMQDYWIMCDGGPGFGRGTGTIDDNDLHLMHSSIDFYCGNTFQVTLEFDFEYDLGTDTITAHWIGIG